MGHIVYKFALVKLPVREFQFPSSISFGLNKLSLIYCPLVFIKFSKIGVVEVSFDHLGVVVVEDSFALKLIVGPISLVCNISFLIEKGSVSIHVVLPPFAVINSSSLVKEFAVSVSFLIADESFIFGAIFIVLNYK